MRRLIALSKFLTEAVKSLTEHERHMITEVIVICKLLLVNPATSAIGERSFSMARRVKTWLSPLRTKQDGGTREVRSCREGRF